MTQRCFNGSTLPHRLTGNTHVFCPLYSHSRLTSEGECVEIVVLTQRMSLVVEPHVSWTLLLPALQFCSKQWKSEIEAVLSLFFMCFFFLYCCHNNSYRYKCLWPGWWYSGCSAAVPPGQIEVVVILQYDSASLDGCLSEWGRMGKLKTQMCF